REDLNPDGRDLEVIEARPAWQCKPGDPESKAENADEERPQRERRIPFEGSFCRGRRISRKRLIHTDEHAEEDQDEAGDGRCDSNSRHHHVLGCRCLIRENPHASATLVGRSAEESLVAWPRPPPHSPRAVVVSLTRPIGLLDEAMSVPSLADRDWRCVSALPRRRHHGAHPPPRLLMP